MEKKIKELEKLINYNFKKNSLLERALTHKSFDNNINNEKLEFLGDRVLGLVISEKLLEKFPDEKEGIIDKKFANLVNKKTCTEIANKINLKKFMVLGKSNKKIVLLSEKIVSDGLEALIGAIFLDKGLLVVEKFILKFWKNYLDKSKFTLIDSKTKLQEYSLKKFKKLPIYKGFKRTGPVHKPIFKVEVQITGSKIFFGTGGSKKIAEQDAAENLLKEMKII